jgi:hypothetical protein
MEVDAEEDGGKGVAKPEASSGKKRVSAPRLASFILSCHCENKSYGRCTGPGR